MVVTTVEAMAEKYSVQQVSPGYVSLGLNQGNEGLTCGNPGSWIIL